MRAAVRALLFGALDGDARTLINAMTVAPTNARQRLISSTIRALKAAGLWAKIDAFYALAAHSSQAGLLNWKNPGTWSLVGTNSPTFTTDRGYQGDGASSFLVASGYNPSTAGGNYSLNSATDGMYVQQASTIANSIDFYMPSASRFSVTGTGQTTIVSRVNDATNQLSSAGAYVAGSHFAARRLSSSGKDLWRNGAQIVATDAVTSTAVGASFGLLAATNVPTNYSNARIAAAYTAGGFSDSEMAAMHSVLTAYLQGVGAA